MSAVLAPPVVVRLPRSAAARRALLTALFLGGFLALALVFGGSAHAASKSGSDSGSGSVLSHLTKHKVAGKATRTAARTATRTTRGLLGHAERDTRHGADEAAQGSGVTHVAQKTTEGATKVVKPVAGKAVRTGSAVRPVGRAVHDVTGLVNLRGLASGLGLGGHAGHCGDGTAPGAEIHVSGPEGHKSGRSADDSAYGTDGRRAQDSRFVVHTAAYHGPAQQAAADRGDGQGNGAPLPGSPMDRTPGTLTTSTTASQGSGGNAHGPRGGGVYQLAAYLTDMERFGHLKPGAVHTADGTPTRDRSRDVLEFPG